MSHGKPYDSNQPRHLIGEIGAGRWKKVDEGHELTSPPEPVRLAWALPKFKVRGSSAPHPSDTPWVAPLREVPKPFEPLPPFIPPVVAPPLVPEPQDDELEDSEKPDPELDRTLELYERLSRGNNGKDRAVAVFVARKYRRGKPSAGFDPKAVLRLTEDEVKDWCEKLEEVQKFTDKAYSKVEDDIDPEDFPAEFGTAVHFNVAQRVNAQKNANYRAEASCWKWEEEEAARQNRDVKGDECKSKKVPYAALNTIRVDVLEKKRGTVCVYDIKTGGARLSRRRMNEISASIFRSFGPTVQNVVVTQVKPSRSKLNAK